MQWATDFYANHSLNGLMDAVEQKMQTIVGFVFFTKCEYFSYGDYCVSNLPYQLQMGFIRTLKG